MLKALCAVLAASGIVACAAQSSSPPSSNLGSTLDALKSLLGDVQAIDVMAFQKPCFECQRSDFLPLELNELATPSRIDQKRASELLILLGQPSSYVLGLAKPCVEFYPSIALRLSMHSGSAALLLYPNCKTARLLTADGKPHAFLNIDPISNKLDRLIPTNWRMQ